MGWERRSNTVWKYYYRSVRVDGRVVKQYVGRIADPVVGLVSRQDQLDRADQATAVDEVRSEQSEYKQLQTLLRTLAGQVRQRLRIYLLSREGELQAGEWTPMTKTPAAAGRKSSASVEEEPTRELFEHLTRQASRGDQEAAERLRRIIRTHPEIWNAVGDLSRHAEQSLIRLIAGKNLVLSECLHVKVDDLRRSLLGTSAEAAIGLLVDQVVINWLELQFVQMAALQPQQHGRDARFWEDRYERAHARYLASVRELQTVRHLPG